MVVAHKIPTTLNRISKQAKALDTLNRQLAAFSRSAITSKLGFFRDKESLKQTIESDPRKLVEQLHSMQSTSYAMQAFNQETSEEELESSQNLYERASIKKTFDQNPCSSMKINSVKLEKLVEVFAWLDLVISNSNDQVKDMEDLAQDVKTNLDNAFRPLVSKLQKQIVSTISYDLKLGNFSKYKSLLDDLAKAKEDRDIERLGISDEQQMHLKSELDRAQDLTRIESDPKGRALANYIKLLYLLKSNEPVKVCHNKTQEILGSMTQEDKKELVTLLSYKLSKDRKTFCEYIVEKTDFGKKIILDRSKIDFLKLLIKEGLDIKTRNGNLQTVLYSLKPNQMRLAKFLMEQKLNPNTLDIWGQTAQENMMVKIDKEYQSCTSSQEQDILSILKPDIEFVY